MTRPERLKPDQDDVPLEFGEEAQKAMAISGVLLPGITPSQNRVLQHVSGELPPCSFTLRVTETGRGTPRCR